MRDCAMALLVVLGGCAADPLAPGVDRGAGCSPECQQPCAAGRVCFGEGSFEYLATCRARCRTSDDCAAGVRCLRVLDHAGEVAGPVCFSVGAVALCPDVRIAACPGPTACDDADTLAAVYFPVDH